MVWHHLHGFLPQYQLLSPPNIQPLVDDYFLKQSPMELIHSGTCTQIYSCVRYEWFRISDLNLHVHSLPPNQLLSPPNIQPLASDLAVQHASMESFPPDTFTDMFVWWVGSFDVMITITPNPSRWHSSLFFRSDIELKLNHIVWQHHIPIHAWMHLLRHVWMLLTGVDIASSANYDDPIDSKRPAWNQKSKPPNQLPTLNDWLNIPWNLLSKC